MAEIVMPKATAVWLIDNTTLTFDQIAQFCGLVPLEVQAIADGEVAVGIQGQNPLTEGILTREELERCQKDPKALLQKAKSDLPEPSRRTKGARYTPLAKRSAKPEGILWLGETHPELSEGQIAKLIGSTHPTVKAILEKKHRLSSTLKGSDPVRNGLVRQAELEKALVKARKTFAEDSEINRAAQNT